VPFVISSGTFIERRSVEFWPGTVGSGEKDIEVSLKREAPFEQSVTEALEATTDARKARTANIILYNRMKSLGQCRSRLKDSINA